MRLYQFIIILFLSVFSVPLINAQDIKVVPQTPNATKLTEFAAQQPNLYTGTATVNVPLYTINFDGWDLPITANYSGTGVRTGEEASEIGLGWALNATGLVSRTIRGRDDLFEGNVSGYGKGYAKDTRPIEHGDLGHDGDHGMCYSWTPAPTSSYYYHVAISAPDTQPDIFNYNFFGYSGSFILKKLNPDTNEIGVINLNEHTCKITFDHEESTFTVQTPTGFKGEFSVQEKSTSFTSAKAIDKRHKLLSHRHIDLAEIKNNSGRFRTTTSWYLKQITSPNGETLSFEYDINLDGSSPYLSKSIYFNDFKIDEVPSATQVVHEHIYLKKIKYANKLEVNFLLEDRFDLRMNDLFTPDYDTLVFPFSKPLKKYGKITVEGSDQSTFQKIIDFKQGYFNAQFLHYEDRAHWLRLRLDALEIDGQSHQFNYYSGAAGLPKKTTTGVDYFGFYNGRDDNPWDRFHYIQNANLGTCTDTERIRYYHQHTERLPNFSFGKAGLLKQVTYPTKGYSTYEYDNHQYLPIQEGVAREQPGLTNAGGARIRKIETTDYDGQLVAKKTFDYRADNAFTSGKLMTPLYNVYIHTINCSDGGMMCRWEAKNNSSIPGNNAAEGKDIGYSKVTVETWGEDQSYKNEYYFENQENEIVEFNYGVSANEDFNGQLLVSKYYDNLNNLVQVNEYLDFKHRIDSIKGLYYTIGNPAEHVIWHHTDYFIKQYYKAPTEAIVSIADPRSPIVMNGSEVMSYGNAFQSITKTLFNEKFQVHETQTYNSAGDTVRTVYKRPLDYENPHQVLDGMISAFNLIDPVIEEINYVNRVETSATGTKFDQRGNFYHPVQTYFFNRSLGSFGSGSVDGYTFTAPYELRLSYEYDHNNNLIQYSGEDGVQHSFVYDVTNELPVVYGKNVIHDELKNAHNAALAGSAYESDLRASFSEQPVMTYQHDPYVGVTQIADENERAVSYVYDDVHRLERIVRLGTTDATLQQFEYNFKEVPKTRVIDVTERIDFGTIVPQDITNFWDTVNICNNSLARTFKIFNNGNDNLEIYHIQPPSGFIAAYDTLPNNPDNSLLFVIPPQSSVDYTILFEGIQNPNNSSNLIGGLYSGTIAINSNRTQGPNSILVTANYEAAICDLLFPSDFVSFGEQVDNYTARTVDLVNNGNHAVYLESFDFENHDQFSGQTMGVCIAPGETKGLNVYHSLQQGVTASPQNTTMTVNPWYCSNFNDEVILYAGYSEASKIDLSASSLDFGTFEGASSSRQITVKNEGLTSFNVTGVSFSNSNVASDFTITPNTFTVEPFSEQVVNVTYAASSFGPISSNLTFQGTMQEGNPTFAVTANRKSVKRLSLSTSWLSLRPWTSPGSVYLYAGNTPVTITSVGNSNSLNFSVEFWSNNGTPSRLLLPVTIQPYQSVHLKVFYNSNNTSTGEITINSDAIQNYKINVSGEASF